MSQSDPPSVPFSLEQLQAIFSRADFSRRFSAHTERGAALSIVAQLDNALYLALRKWLVDDEDAIESMFREMQPLGSLGARVRMGYLLGMYGKPLYENLKIVSRVRNRFAHVQEANGFDDQKILSWTNSLTVLQVAAGIHTAEGQTFNIAEWLPGSDPTKPYWKFTLSVFLLSAIVAVAGRLAPTRPAPIV